MKIEKDMSVSASSLFEHLAESIAYDYAQATTNTLELPRIREGFHYTKTMSSKAGTSGNVELTITKWVQDKLYEAEIKSYQGINRFSYLIEEKEGGVHLTYSEDFDSPSKVKQFNHKLMSYLYLWRGKKRMKILLNAIEQHLIKKEEELCQN